MNKKIKFGELFFPLPKSKRMAKDARNSGIFPFFICSEVVKSSNYSDYKEEALILSTGGKANIHYCNSEFSASADTWVIKINSDQLDTKYAFYFLENKKNIIEEIGFQGSGLKHLNKEFIRDIEIPLPPLPEQKKIAEILSEMDQLISITQRNILKQNNIKNGLLSSLIGNLPPKIKLDDVAKRVSGHTPSKSHKDYWNGGIPWVSLTDTSKLDKRYIHETSKEISNLGIENSSAVLHPTGTVIISRDARVGCSAVTTKPMAVSQHFIGWVCSENLHNMFLYYCLQHWKPRFENIAMGSTIPTIGLSFFKDLMISLPSINEQKNIAKSLESIDDSIKSLINKIQFFENLKKGLMADLLSGRKRVSI